MEVFGGWAPDACKLFRQVARCHRDLLDPSLTQHQPSWAARSFSAYHSQRISVAIHYSSAAEIVTGRRWAVASIRRGMRQGRAERRAARQGRGHRTPAAPVRAQAVCPPVTATTFPTLAAAGSPATAAPDVAAADAARAPAAPTPQTAGMAGWDNIHNTNKYMY